jgi:hypothetical protein
MRPNAVRPILSYMDETHIFIGLELDGTEETFSGRILHPDGRVIEFAGRLGLIVALDGLVSFEPAAPPGANHTTHCEGVTP